MRVRAGLISLIYKKGPTDSSDERKEEGKAAHRLGDGANKHAERDDVAVESLACSRLACASEQVSSL
jgi:hypothetical protein